MTSLFKLLDLILESESELELDYSDLLNEDKGNLKDIPDVWMKKLAQKYRSNAMAGQNSEVKEIASNIANISKFRTTIIDSAKLEKTVGYFVKLNDQPFSLVFPSADSNTRITYELIGHDGSQSAVKKYFTREEKSYVSSSDRRAGKRTKISYSTASKEIKDLPMSEILTKLTASMIDAVTQEGEKSDEVAKSFFKNNKVDVYVVTRDEDRAAKQNDRSNARQGSTRGDDAGLRKELEPAQRKFIEKKLSGVRDTIEKDTSAIIERLKDAATKSISSALEGNYNSKDVYNNFDKDIVALKNMLANISQLSSRLQSMTKKSGGYDLVRRWGTKPEKTWDLNYLLKSIAEIEKETKKD